MGKKENEKKGKKTLDLRSLK